MNRRKFLIASGASTIPLLFGFRPSLGVEFQISDNVTKNPDQLNSVLVDFTKFKIYPQYLDTNKQDYIEISILINVEDDYVKQYPTQSVEIQNGGVQSLSDKFSPIHLDSLNFNNRYQVSGSVNIDVSHPDISKSYVQEFKVTSPDIPSEFVSNFDFDSGLTNWTKINSANVSVNNSIADIDNGGEKNAGLKQIIDFVATGTYTMTKRSKTSESQDGQPSKTKLVTSGYSADIDSSTLRINSESYKTKSMTFEVNSTGQAALLTRANYTFDASVDYVSIQYNE